MFGGGGGGAMLLAIPKVQEELKITDEQKTKLQALAEKLGAEMRERFAGFRDLSDEERQKRMEEMQAEGAKRLEEVRKQVAEILKPEQVKRLRQIELQQQGVRALERAEVAEELGITDAQKADMQKVREEIEAKMQAMREERRGQQGPPSEERMAEFRKMREEAEAKVMAVLTDAQKQKLRDMMGEPFEMPPMEFGRGPGGRGNRGGGQQ